MRESFSIPLPAELEAPCKVIAQRVETLGGRAVLVGGCVRDALLGKTPKDIDIEVFGVSPDRLEAALKQDFAVDIVGKAFGVLKLKKHPIDVSIPRRESKTGLGHTGFAIEGDPNMSFEEAAARRDFTVNAISWNPCTQELIDPYKGQVDLEKGILRHTSDQFAEDPLRVLRAMQFVGRFELSVAPETLALCQSIEPEDLPKERIFEEWKKLILKSVKPSLGMTFLKDCGWVKYYPELEALIGCEQNPEWHPEGDVWVHTLHCLDAFAKERIHDEWEDLVVGFAVLCHDLGKPATSFIDEKGCIRSPKHEVVGEHPTRSFLARMTEHKDLIESVVPLVLTHMRPVMLYKDQAGDAAIRRLAHKVKRIDRLLRVVSADLGGRPPFPKGDFKEEQWLLEKAEALELKDKEPQPIVLGRHLIERGMKPGPNFGKILAACFEAQLDGEFEDLEGGLTYLNNLEE